MLLQNKYYKSICLITILVLFSGCWSLRSAEGLSGGELNINYVAPVAGSVRYGIVDNLEARFTFAGEALTYDLFVHTNKNDNSSNYGAFLGYHSFGSTPAKYYYSGFVYSKRLSNYFNPYASICLFYDNSIKRIDYEGSYYAVGAEVEIPLFKQLSLLITPEIGHQIKYNPGGDFDTRGWSATGNVGLIIKLY